MKTSDVLSTCAVLISIAATGFSIFSYSETKSLTLEGFDATFRPYVFAVTSGYINKDDGKLYTIMNKVDFKVINQPAKINYEYIAYYLVDSGNSFNKADTIFTKKFENLLMYPSDVTSYYTYVDSTIINDSVAIKARPRILRRRILVSYSWLAINKATYSYGMETDYDVINHGWGNSIQDGN